MGRPGPCGCSTRRNGLGRTGPSTGSRQGGRRTRGTTCVAGACHGPSPLRDAAALDASPGTGGCRSVARAAARVLSGTLGPRRPSVWSVATSAAPRGTLGRARGLGIARPRRKVGAASAVGASRMASSTRSTARTPRAVPGRTPGTRTVGLTDRCTPAAANGREASRRHATVLVAACQALGTMLALGATAAAKVSVASWPLAPSEDA